jgi:dipeptidyl aminopeptidase/acylaminoacyl peptidase
MKNIINVKFIFYIAIIIFVFGGIFIFTKRENINGTSDENISNSNEVDNTRNSSNEMNHENDIDSDPMEIEALRERDYPPRDIVIEEALPNGTNYRQYIASYLSERLKIYGLLTVPLAERPEKGFPAIVFVHGYIPPEQYSTTGDYPTYQATLARAGFVTFKPDLRGHGRSEGEPVSAHFSEKYVVDVLNAIAHMKQHPDIDPKRVGYWGHSNGGEIGLRVAVVSDDVRAFVLWAGVVGSYEDMFETYLDDIPFLKDRSNPLVATHGLPSAGSDFWRTVDPYYHLDDIEAPIELHHGTNDASVPIALSESLVEQLETAGKDVTLYRYEGDDHNIANNASVAWSRTIDFYRQHLDTK